MKKLLSILTATLGLMALAETEYNAETAAQNAIGDVVVRQNWPWSPTVTVAFTVSGLAETNAVDLSLYGIVGETSFKIPMNVVRGATRGVQSGTHTLSFNPMDIPLLAVKGSIADFRVQVKPRLSTIDPNEILYMVVDLSAATAENAVTHLTRKDIMSGVYGSFETNPAWIENTPALTNCLVWTGVTKDNVYRTTKLVLRKIPAGTFSMGSPSGELGRGDETRHQVTLTKDYWISVFEFTQAQYKLLMGALPTQYNQNYPGDLRPVECSYNLIRGMNVGTNWPASTDVDADSVMDVLRRKTGLAFDLPTEAQWECACRAGTTAALNSGRNLTDATTCPNLAELARYMGNRSDGVGGHAETRENTTTVGSYKPNAWGLYDMHGNLWEWCLDWNYWFGGTSLEDPTGPESNKEKKRIVRGGGCYSAASGCRSASRSGNTADNWQRLGIRVTLTVNP